MQRRQRQLLPTTRLDRSLTTSPKVSGSRHVVIEGAFRDVTLDLLPAKPDIFFFDTPSVDVDCDVSEYAAWLSEQFTVIERLRKRDAILYLVPTDRKGNPWSKSVSTAHVAELFDWQLFRHYIWLKQEADYHRAQYAFQDVWVYRKGARGASGDADARYKDVIRIVAGRDGDSHVGTIPVDLVEYFLPLFSRADDIVMDPFAGRGSVMQACHSLGLRSVSVELWPERAQYLSALSAQLEGEDD